jgi:hypothetical protein
MLVRQQKEEENERDICKDMKGRRGDNLQISQRRRKYGSLQLAAAKPIK